MPNSSRSLLLAGFLVGLAFNTIAAQEPTQAQRDAMRSACRSDFMAHCASVQPGGKEALECLLKNDSQLSPSCKSAVSAFVHKPEPAVQEPAAPTSAATAGDAAKAQSAQMQDDQIKAIRQACTLDDLMAHCSWIQPSSPEVMLCLKANAAGLSPPCRAAIASRSDTPPPSPADIGRKEQMTPQPRNPERVDASPPSPPVSSQKGTLRNPTGEQKNAIRAACRSDFMSHCSTVQPGGMQAMRCLQRNAAQLSPQCKTALAAITRVATAAAPATPAESATSSSVAPLTPMPALRPRTALAILRICGEEMRLLCGDVPPGGSRVISCLAEHAPRLSPVCYRALAAARNY